MYKKLRSLAHIAFFDLQCQWEIPTDGSDGLLCVTQTQTYSIPICQTLQRRALWQRRDEGEASPV